MIRDEIAAADGNEVSFVGCVDAAGQVTSARAIARGDVGSVLALPGEARRGEMMIHNHPSGRLEPSSADLGIAARMHDDGIGFAIVDNAATRLYVVVEVSAAAKLVPLDPFEIVAQLGADGPVAAEMGEYEDRPSQRDMAAWLVDGYNDGGVLLLEAGTGIGKSFAYLVPALAWARANGERTVVSTNTINLQEQLVGKDLPLLERALSEDEYRPSYALLKGWRNYLCKSRLENAVAAQQSLLDPGKLPELLDLVAWAAQTKDGSLADLATEPSREIWDEVAAEADLCTRTSCSHFNDCFVFRARRRAAVADVVVVNHHLLTADLAVRQASDNWDETAVLPAYRRLIIDEGHNLEDVAAHHLGRQASSAAIARLLNRMEHGGKGLLPSLQHELAGADDLLSRASLDLIRDRLIPANGEARRAVIPMVARLRELIPADRPGPLRLDDDFGGHEAWSGGLDQELDAVLLTFRRMGELLEIVADRLAQVEMTEQRNRLLLECRGVTRRLEATSDALAAVLRPAAERPSDVRWIERVGREGRLLRLAAVPLDLAPVLRELLFDRLDTVAITSATLAASGDFDFLATRLGLAGPDSPVTVSEILPSPFDYGSQCLLGIPNDVPDPREDPTGHDIAMAEVVNDLAWAGDGGMFVLFTSHAQLQRVARLVRIRLGERFPLLVQGDAQRDHLVKRFREAGNAILFGTDSFWEGVDVPGRALRGLVLAKLPFKVPSEPITAARLERIAEQGGDGFMEYLLPHAALKLKQGFGRLIRSMDDVGVVLLLDRRVITKRYGSLVLRGLPPAERVIGTWAEVRTRCEDFLARNGIGAAME